MDFAVQVKGLDTGTNARWVLAVDAVGERVLITHDDRSLHWVPIDECKFVKASPPDTPRPVVVVKPQPQPGKLVTAAKLTEMRQRR